MKNLIILILIFVVGILSGCGRDTDNIYVDKSRSYLTKILEEQPILIKNGDFEDGINDWGFRPFSRENLNIQQEGRNNSKGVVANFNELLNCTFVQSITNTLKVSSILFEGWIKTIRLKGYADYSVECINDKYSHSYKIGDDKIKRPIYGLLHSQGSEKFSADTSWIKVSMKVYVPIETEKIVIFCSASATEGSAYFDDIVVKGLSVYW